MPAKRCPVCGATQQWSLWQRCYCGHDFGAPEPDPSVVFQPQPPASPRFVEVRYGVAVVFQVAAIGMAFFVNPHYALFVAMAGIAILPVAVKPTPERTPLSRTICLVAGIVLFVMATAYIKANLPHGSIWKHRIDAASVVSLALIVLGGLPKRWRELQVEARSRG